MKLPALWIAAAFAAGIRIASRCAASPKCGVGGHARCDLIAGRRCARWRARMADAWVFALVAWIALGGLAVAARTRAVPANHVTRCSQRGSSTPASRCAGAGGCAKTRSSASLGTSLRNRPRTSRSAGRVFRSAAGCGRIFTRGPRTDGSPPQGLARRRPRGSAPARAATAQFSRSGRVRPARLSRAPENRPDRLAAQRRTAAADRPPAADIRSQRLARARGDLLARLDALFASAARSGGGSARDAAGRPQLRRFGRRSAAFQKTAAYHVLVVAGLHVGALVVFVFWFCRRLRFSDRRHELRHARASWRPTSASCRTARRFSARR